MFSKTLERCRKIWVSNKNYDALCLCLNFFNCSWAATWKTNDTKGSSLFFLCASYRAHAIKFFLSLLHPFLRKIHAWLTFRFRVFISSSCSFSCGWIVSIRSESSSENSSCRSLKLCWAASRADRAAEFITVLFPPRLSQSAAESEGKTV